MSTRIDGKKISEEIGQKLFLELQNRKLIGKVSLGILCVGNDPASITFINVKKRFGEKYGFAVNILKLSEPGLLRLEDSPDFKNQIILELKKLQEENNAVIVQLPLPENLRIYTDEILNCIEKKKDVDNLNGGNFTAPIVLALQKILGISALGPLFKGAGERSEDWGIFGIVGLGQVVGLPIYNHLVENKYNVVKIGRDNFNEIKNCDVVISGVGSPHLIKKEDIKDGAVLIDYGCSYADTNGQQKMCGDFDLACYDKSAFYTPVPGCMGPLVVACLFENVLKSYEEDNN